MFRFGWVVQVFTFNALVVSQFSISSSGWERSNTVCIHSHHIHSNKSMFWRATWLRRCLLWGSPKGLCVHPPIHPEFFRGVHGLGPYRAFRTHVPLFLVFRELPRSKSYGSNGTVAQGFGGTFCKFCRNFTSYASALVGLFVDHRRCVSVRQRTCL